MFRAIGIGFLLLSPLAVVGTVLLNVIRPHDVFVVVFVFVLGVLAAVVGIAVDERIQRRASGSGSTGRMPAGA